MTRLLLTVIVTLTLIGVATTAPVKPSDLQPCWVWGECPQWPASDRR
jgi:hypothetical protein